MPASIRVQTQLGKFSSDRWHDQMLVYAFHTDRKVAGFKIISEDDEQVSIECQPAGSVSGTVVNSKGEPLAKQVVMMYFTVAGEAGASFRESTETDEDGKFRFPPMVSGTSGAVGVQLLLGLGQQTEFKISDAEDLQLAPLVIDN